MEESADTIHSALNWRKSQRIPEISEDFLPEIFRKYPFVYISGQDLEKRPTTYFIMKNLYPGHDIYRNSQFIYNLYVLFKADILAGELGTEFRIINDVSDAGLRNFDPNLMKITAYAVLNYFSTIPSAILFNLPFYEAFILFNINCWSKGQGYGKK